MHDWTHEFHADVTASGHIGDGGLDECGYFVVGELGWLIFLQDRYFGEFLIGKFLAAGVGVDLGGFFAFFDFAGENFEYLVVVKLVSGAGSFLGGECGEEHAERAGALFVVGFHGGFHVVPDLCLQVTHSFLLYAFRYCYVGGNNFDA